MHLANKTVILRIGAVAVTAVIDSEFEGTGDKESYVRFTVSPEEYKNYLQTMIAADLPAAAMSTIGREITITEDDKIEGLYRGRSNTRYIAEVINV